MAQKIVYICIYPIANYYTMPLLDKIREPVAAELDRYEQYIEKALHIDHDASSSMLAYVLNSRGKGIRPLMVVLAASMYNEKMQVPEETLLSAMLIEMVHTASLVHDDVIDEAYIRRGIPSAKAMWRSRRSVLIGDYILAKSFSFGMEKEAYELVHYISLTMSDLCEGELLQSEQSDVLEMTREVYNKIIFKKTASLLGTSSGVGAFSVGASKEIIDNMRTYGDSLGMAFQIKDDMLDFTPTSNTGKPACGDLRERKITLPLLTVLEKSDESQQNRIISLLSDVRNNPSNADLLCDIVLERGGLEMAAKEVENHIKIAREALYKCPESKYRTALDQLCTYVAERDM